MENENKIPQYDIHGALRIGRFTSGDSQAQYYVEETLYIAHIPVPARIRRSLLSLLQLEKKICGRRR